MSDIDNTQDIIDVRDLIEEYEASEFDPSEDGRVYREGMRALLDELKGYGGDEQWRGDWYPLLLIRDSYFTEYTEELVRDCYEMPATDSWPFTHLTFDWEGAAEDLKQDYATVEYDGVTYWYR